MKQMKMAKKKTFRQLVEENWQTPNQIILQHIRDTADDKGYPNISNWSNFIQGKNEVEVYSTLMNYILTSNLPLPSRRGKIEDIQNAFYKYKYKIYSPFVHANDVDRELIHRLTESERYKYDYSKEYTLGYFPQYTQANIISNHFAEGERLECEVINKETPNFLWREEHGVSRLMDTMRRIGVKNMNEANFRSFFAHAGQIASQFNVNTAKNIYNTAKGDIIFDISCGWGDRLTGFYLSEKETYYGTDPNLNMFEIYKKMCLTYEKWLGCENPKFVEGKNYFEIHGKKNVRIYSLPAEDVNYDELPDIDLTFSSPPYFNKELYGKNSATQDNQSWSRYSSGDAWLNEFLYKILDTLISKSKTTMVNITDIGIDKHQVKICDPMVERYKDSFVGIAGFQLSKNMNVKDAKSEYTPSLIYTEPIWTFGKPLIEKNQTSLLDFFT